MALKRPVTAVTAKEAAIEAATLKSVAQRLDPKDAITSEGKASKEQALAESSTQSATDRKGVEDYEQAPSSADGGGSGDSRADLIVSVADIAAAAAAGDRKEVSDYDQVGKATGTGDFAGNYGGEENFSPFAPSTQAEREAAVAAHLGVGELSPELAALLRTKEEVQADEAAEAHDHAGKSLREIGFDVVEGIYAKKAEHEQFDDLKPSVADDGGGQSRPGYELVPNGDGKYIAYLPDGQVEILAPDPADGFLSSEEMKLGTSEAGDQPDTDQDGQSIGQPAGSGKANSPTPGCTPGTVVECAPDDEQVPLEVKLKWREIYGDTVPQPGEAAAGGAKDPVEGDGTQIFGAGGLTLDQVQTLRDLLVDPPDDAKPAVEVVRPDFEAGGDIDPTEDALDPSGTGLEDDPLDRGHDFSAETSLSSGEESSSSSAETGESSELALNLAADLRLADDPAAMLKYEDFDLLSQQSEPAADIVPDFHLETLPMPGLDPGPLFATDLV